MKISVLLPTRNRLEYLKYAISSVMQQDYADWEIIISDNFSEDDVESYAKSLSDSRVHYYRTKEFLPVTDNWNNALEKSIGDFVVMMGDDDCLLPGYFRTCAALIKQHNPDLIYNNAIQYTYPKVIPDAPDGFLVQYGYASFLVSRDKPYILEKNEGYRLVQKIMNFNVIVNFNAQHTLVSRELVMKMQKKGKFYQSPYPDYYATTALLLSAEKILAVPYRLVVIGVSPKSFGYFYHNDKENEGNEFLKNSGYEEIYNRIAKWFFPGTNMNTSWLMAMETVRYNFGMDYFLKVNYKKYRFLQVLNHLKKIATKETEIKDLWKIIRCMFWWEKLFYLIPILIAFYIRLYPRKSRTITWVNKMLYKFSHPTLDTPKVFSVKYSNILDVYKNFPDFGN